MTKRNNTCNICITQIIIHTSTYNFNALLHSMYHYLFIHSFIYLFFYLISNSIKLFGKFFILVILIPLLFSIKSKISAYFRLVKRNSTSLNISVEFIQASIIYPKNQNLVSEGNLYPSLNRIAILRCILEARCRSYRRGSHLIIRYAKR